MASTNFRSRRIVGETEKRPRICIILSRRQNYSYMINEFAEDILRDGNEIELINHQYIFTLKNLTHILRLYNCLRFFNLKYDKYTRGKNSPNHGPIDKSPIKMCKDADIFLKIRSNTRKIDRVHMQHMNKTTARDQCSWYCPSTITKFVSYGPRISPAMKDYIILCHFVLPKSQALLQPH